MQPHSTAVRLLLALAILPNDGCHAFSSVGSTLGVARHHHLFGRSSSSRLPTAIAAAESSAARDVIVVGGGLAGLSVAHHIATKNENLKVTLIDRDDAARKRSETTAGSFASAGALAPQSGYMPSGPLADLLKESRTMYDEWVQIVESGAMASKDGEGGEYLPENSAGDPWDVGFRTEGGFFAPLFDESEKDLWLPDTTTWTLFGEIEPMWLDADKARELEPELSEEVVGGWFVPDSARIDSRRLTMCLRAACSDAGVEMCLGDKGEAVSLKMGEGTDSANCEGVTMKNGETVYASQAVVVANGSFMKQLVNDVPVNPVKGQCLLLQMPADTTPILSRVVFRGEAFVVPMADGHIAVGSTKEPGLDDGAVAMSEGSDLDRIFSEAKRILPALESLPIVELFAGLRPTTPDNGPILGKAKGCDNVYIAGGQSCSGTLLAPKTAQLIGDLVAKGGDVDALSKKDKDFLQDFSWKRFNDNSAGWEKYASWFDQKEDEGNGVKCI